MLQITWLSRCTSPRLPQHQPTATTRFLCRYLRASRRGIATLLRLQASCRGPPRASEESHEKASLQGGLYLTRGPSMPDNRPYPS